MRCVFSSRHVDLGFHYFSVVDCSLADCSCFPPVQLLLSAFTDPLQPNHLETVVSLKIRLFLKKKQGIFLLIHGSLQELQRLYDELVEKVDACRLDLYATSKNAGRSRRLWSHVIPQTSYASVKGLNLYGGLATGGRGSNFMTSC